MFFQRRPASRSQDQITAHRFPDYGRGERAADAVVHAVGVASGFSAGAWLLAVAPLSNAEARGPLAVYIVGIVCMLAASATYNAFQAGPIKEWLRRIDHAVIFAAIAGTYTPLLILRMPKEIGVALCAVVWLAATAGAALKLMAPRRYERLGLACYLALGWVGLPAGALLAETLKPDTLRLIIIGGVIYTVGVGAHLLTRLRYHNALWHALVLAAAGCHFMAMFIEFAAARG